MLFLTMGVFTKYIFLPVIFAFGIIFSGQEAIQKFILSVNTFSFWFFGHYGIIGNMAVFIYWAEAPRPFYGRPELFWAFVYRIGEYFSVWSISV